jgi:hypothetical protein
MGTFNANILPTATGLDLGSSNQRWDGNIQTLDVAGNATITGNATISGTLAVTGTTTHTGAVTLSGGITSGAAIATPTITSPVINGTPSGTGIPTLTLKKGSGVGTYTTASASFVDVDATNLSYTVTIPTGWKLSVAARGELGVQTALVPVEMRIIDGSTEIAISRILPAALNTFPAGDAHMIALITGDGASHTVKLQFKTTNAADTCNLSNSSSTDTPMMLFNLCPSN